MDGGNHLKIYDLSDPAKPVYIRDFGMVGTQPGASGSEEGEGIHGAISAGPEKNRVYIAYGTGNDGVISIVDRKKLLTEFKNPLTPTRRSCSRRRSATCTCLPTRARTRPSRSSACRSPASRGIRRCGSAICSSSCRRPRARTTAARTTRPISCCRAVPAPHLAFLLDITHEPTPWPLSTFRVQETQGDYCGRGGRFGAHSSAESFYPPYYGKIAVFAWFNAGVRIWDIRDPFAVHEVAYFVPPANQNTVPTCANAETQRGRRVRHRNGDQQVQEGWRHQQRGD